MTFMQTLIRDQIGAVSKKIGRQLTTGETVKLTAAITLAVTEDRARCAAITSCPEAAQRRHMAEHVALNTDMSVDDSKALLAVAPLESTGNWPTPFSQFMDRNAPAGVGAGIAREEGSDDEMAAKTVDLCKRLGLKGFGQTKD